MGIEELFPSETQHVYFIPYYKEGNKVSPNRGKLYDKYCNIKKEIRKTSTQNINKPCNKQNEVFSNEEDILDSLVWLKHNIEPEFKLYQLWSETAHYRLSKHTIDNNDNLKYPALKKPTGHILINMDFDHLFPKKDQCLIQKFDIFKEKLKLYLKNKDINLNLNEQNLVKKILTPDILGDDDLAVIQILPYLFKPVNIKVPKKSTTDGNVSKYLMRKPSKLEQASAVIVNITNVNDLKTTHERKIDRAFNCGLTVQPYVAIVGNQESNSNDTIGYYTVINDIYYKLETPIKALDTCFKSFHALNLQYPQEAEQIWWFIQDFFF
ncbi:unnamed protein product [Macrosiphum euphorbiae]|uniref:Uncharacterized protein n=1 Tax=Macrosiphum euphorbiae TaxID=13131 RepID=A0AAV0XSR5_9HEMI|nr:unnamed protein product [Macrosiphum euphorbiae]